MPKVYLTTRDRVLAAYRERDREFQEQLLIRLRRRAMPQKDLEPLIGISHSTAHRRFKNPEQLTIGQARIIFDALGFSDDERLSLVGGSKSKGGSPP